MDRIKKLIATTLTGIALTAATSCTQQTHRFAPEDDDTAIVTEEDKQRYKNQKREARLKKQETIRQNYDGSYISLRAAANLGMARFSYKNRDEHPGAVAAHALGGLPKAGLEARVHNTILQDTIPIISHSADELLSN